MSYGTQYLETGAGAKAVPFITNVTGSNAVVTWETTTAPAQKVVASVEYENGGTSLTISGEVDGGPDFWEPTLTISGDDVVGSPVTVASISRVGSNARRFSFSQGITISGPADITLNCDDGASHTIQLIEAAAAPDVTTFTHGSPPGGQTRVKNGDSVSFSATFPAGATKFVLENYELHGTTAVEYTIADTDTSIADTFTVAGSDGNPQSIKAHLRLASGSDGNSKVSTGAGLHHDSAAPTVGNISISNYPGGQSALKNTESCDASCTVSGTQGDTGSSTDWSSIAYSDDGTGELTIPNTTTYAATKGVSRLSGNHRESGTNYKIVVTKSYNGTTTTKTATVRIAHVAPTVKVNGAYPTRLRTDDGTNNYKDHSIELESVDGGDGAMVIGTAPTDANGLVAPKGTWQGSWSQVNNYRYNRSLRIADGDIVSGGTGANSYSWTSCEVKNRAAVMATTVTTNPNYNVGGFEMRTLAIAAWPNREGDIGCLVADTSKLECTNLSKGSSGSLNFTFQASTANAVDKYTITDGAENYDPDNRYWYNCDEENAISNTGGTMQIEIEETA